MRILELAVQVGFSVNVFDMRILEQAVQVGFSVMPLI